MSLPTSAAAQLPIITADMARELALAQRVCIRPLLRRVEDRLAATEDFVAIPCGCTREAVCPPCAQKARGLRMQQCTEGWHCTDEPEREPASRDQASDASASDEDTAADEFDDPDRRVRSTRRRQDAPDLPPVRVEDRTTGRVFVTVDGREYRPSMFLTLTMPSYGPVTATGAPVNPDGYDYRRHALDALHFARLVDRFWQNLRRVAGYKVQYFATVEPQQRLVPHLHAAIRGSIPRRTFREVVKATYLQLWWPPFDRAVYVHRTPVWDGQDYVDADTGEVLPTWAEALDRLAGDPEAPPAHVMRFGRQLDMAGILAGTPEADKTVRYLTKYLTKSIADTHAGDEPDPAYLGHLDRLHAELRWLPCSPGCANWLRYGIQPDHSGPGLRAGKCPAKAHDREHLGLGGRRVLVSRQWSGKTLTEHRADRATVVREALLEAGILAPEIERMAADVTLADGSPRFVWTDTRPDPVIYARVLLQSIAERHRWREQYERAKAGAVDDCSATGPPHTSGSPDSCEPSVAGSVVKGERSESEGHGAQRSALDDRPRDRTIPISGEAEKPSRADRST